MGRCNHTAYDHSEIRCIVKVTKTKIKPRWKQAVLCSGSISTSISFSWGQLKANPLYLCLFYPLILHSAEHCPSDWAKHLRSRNCSWLKGKIYINLLTSSIMCSCNISLLYPILCVCVSVFTETTLCSRLSENSSSSVILHICFSE